MSHTPHELAEEFPADQDRIQELKLKDAHFAGLVEAYHIVNGIIHRAETDVEPMADDHVTDLRKERLMLKDAIATALRAAA